MYGKLANWALQIYASRLYKKYDYLYSPPPKERNPSLPIYLNGWQAVCMETEIKEGSITSKNIMGEDIIVWRGYGQEVCVTEPFCAHFGVHMGAGGIVIDDTIRCPLHHRRFRKDGSCLGKKMRGIYAYPVDVQMGIVFVWFDQDKNTPHWHLPDLKMDMHNIEWKSHHDKFRGINVPAHPIEYIENGVDYNHAVHLHGFRYDGSEFHEEKEKLSVKFIHKEKFKGDIDIHAYGPLIIDYNITYALAGKSHQRFLVLLQFMRDGSFISHRVKLIRTEKKVFSLKLLTGIGFVFTEFKTFKAFMTQDLMIMINRKFLDTPDYDRFDEYSKQFREWYSKFYK